MRRPYVRLYHHSSQWSVMRTYDLRGTVIQINLGHVGVTIPYRSRSNP